MENKINIDELKELIKEIKNTYDDEKKQYEAATNVNDKEIMGKELLDIIGEIDKIEKIIKIYDDSSDNKELIIAKLERLYMQQISGNTNEEEFNKIDFDEKFNIFDSFFPKEWVLRNDLDKEQILLDAIIKNEAIQVPPKNNIL